MSNHNIVQIASIYKHSASRSNSDFTVNFENHRSLTGIVKIVVKAVDSPNVFYNINSKGFNKENIGNNIYRWLDADYDLHNMVVPPGQYTIAELINVLNTGMAT